MAIIDDLSTGKAANIAHLGKNPDFVFTKGSILDRRLLEKTFKGADYIFHQAAVPSGPRSIADPAATNEANVTGTLNGNKGFALRSSYLFLYSIYLIHLRLYRRGG